MVTTATTCPLDNISSNLASQTSSKIGIWIQLFDSLPIWLSTTMIWNELELIFRAILPFIPEFTLQMPSGGCVHHKLVSGDVQVETTKNTHLVPISFNLIINVYYMVIYSSILFTKGEKLLVWTKNLSWLTLLIPKSPID